MKIIGICMIRNEDVFIEQAIRNVVEFCDQIYVDDNMSTDNTPGILERLAQEFSHVAVRRIKDTVESNDMLEQYMGTDTWVLAVDGDELYDPAGLSRFRRRLEAGEFDRYWMIYGNVLHCSKLDHRRTTADGHLSPPSYSMTKLYNFSMINKWPIVNERLHGTPVFKPELQEIPSKLSLNEAVTWDDAEFRCLHTAFIKRSSKEKSNWKTFGVRLNPPQLYVFVKTWKQHGWFYALPRNIKYALTLIFRTDDKRRRYQKGPKVKKEVGCFFDESNNGKGAAIS